MNYTKFSKAHLKRIINNNKIAQQQIFFNPSKKTNDGYEKENKEIQKELVKRKNEKL